jgi:hypothetical protein
MRPELEARQIVSMTLIRFFHWSAMPAYFTSLIRGAAFLIRVTMLSLPELDRGMLAQKNLNQIGKKKKKNLLLS